MCCKFSFQQRFGHIAFGRGRPCEFQEKETNMLCDSSPVSAFRHGGRLPWRPSAQAVVSIFTLNGLFLLRSLIFNPLRLSALLSVCLAHGHLTLREFVQFDSKCIQSPTKHRSPNLYTGTSRAVPCPDLVDPCRAKYFRAVPS